MWKGSRGGVSGRFRVSASASSARRAWGSPWKYYMRSASTHRDRNIRRWRWKMDPHGFDAAVVVPGPFSFPPASWRSRDPSFRPPLLCPPNQSTPPLRPSGVCVFDSAVPHFFGPAAECNTEPWAVNPVRVAVKVKANATIGGELQRSLIQLF